MGFEDPEERWRIQTPDERFDALAISDDAMARRRGTGIVRLLETDNGKMVRTLEVPLPDDPFEAMAFSEDKKFLAGGGYGNVVFLWDLSTKNPARLLVNHEGVIAALKFLPGSKILASTSHDHTTRFWNTSSGKELCRLLAFDDGSWLVTDTESRFDFAGDAKSTVAYWIVGEEAFPLDRFREQYQDPGLLAKHLGFSKTPLRVIKGSESYGNSRFMVTGFRRRHVLFADGSRIDERAAELHQSGGAVLWSNKRGSLDAPICRGS